MGGKSRGSHEEGGGGGHDGGGSLRWLLSYADMITLLMAFFIMLYSMSILNLNKFRQVAISIKSGFGGVVEGQGKSVLGSSGQFGVKPSPIDGDSVGVSWQVVSKVQTLIKEKKLQNQVRMRADERGLIVSLVTDEVLFAKGQANLSLAVRKLLDEVAEIVRPLPNSIVVEGHTCDLRLASKRYPTNWELSTNRATTVVRYLIEHCGIPSARLAAEGYADSKPLVPNLNEKFRAINRRVDIVILRTEKQEKKK